MDRIQFEQSGAIDFAARVNDALSKDEKNVVRFDSDESLTSALNDVAAKLDRDFLAKNLRRKDWKAVLVSGREVRIFRDKMKVGEEAGLNICKFNEGNTYSAMFVDCCGDVGPYGENNHSCTWQFFKNDTTNTDATADLVIIRCDGSNPAKRMAEYFSQVIAGGRMPVENDTSKCKSKYKYNYTGNIDAVKVDGADGNAPFYLVGFKITQTAVPLVDGK